ncbi:HpcH/HpaI aldolase/citrate lyase family protein [Brucella neotomae]|uniref:HpcH/HpaI aldolase n=1 Tax=Brucella neotomae 5K33 TaxID=520456 RepID=A0A7U8PW17_BRUNE|nr:CoA ester lyase [Brucella neotomae]EEY03041.1 HpcH/HpaI aldolase [Brucella neotomae 5K33]KEX99303.1 aldolase [Brucella neotomae 5K33]KFJ57709.1 hpcH/HpaI aldolase/citrate lyase family protein [Brucella neotomae 5K33]SPU68444.1 citrate lyase subunit beta [Brucella neotomae]SPU69939.1 citrate lyase subunit beta [Brucella neotomae]
MVSIASIRAPLFVPADRPDRFSKAAASGTDCVILDLEDAVAPKAKDAARAALDTSFTDLPVMVRINPHGTPWHEADMAAVTRLDVAGVILPKAETAERIEAAARMLDLPLIALVETARGLANARSIAAASGVVRLAFGSIDFCADLACAHMREILLPARVELVMASRLAGIAAPIDGVTPGFNDPVMCHQDAAHARALGMMGKLCIHPRQISEVLRAFAWSDQEIDWARRVLASGEGAISIDGMMVDEPVRIRARTILEQADIGAAPVLTKPTG